MGDTVPRVPVSGRASSVSQVNVRSSQMPFSCLLLLSTFAFSTFLDGNVALICTMADITEPLMSPEGPKRGFCGSSSICMGRGCDDFVVDPMKFVNDIDTDALRNSLDVKKWSGYESVVNAIVRPPRAFYNYGALGRGSLTLNGMAYIRQDLDLKNDRNMTLKCSHWIQQSNQKLPCVVYCHGNSGCRADALR